MAGGDKNIKIGVVQMNSGRDIEPNLETLIQFVRCAALEGAWYVQTPENSLLMELDRARVAAIAASSEYSAALQAISDLASSLEIYIHLGSAASLIEDGREPKLANRSYLFGPDGEIAANYDKIHMFDVKLSNGESYTESAAYRAGDSAIVADCGFAKIGMTICYDLRFAALYRALAKGGAEIFSVPAAFTKLTGAAHWHVLLRARAIETGSFVIAAAQTGTHDNGRETYGRSLVVNPWGEVISDGGSEPHYFCCDIDLADIDKARVAIPSLTSDQPFKLS